MARAHPKRRGGWGERGFFKISGRGTGRRDRNDIKGERRPGEGRKLGGEDSLSVPTGNIPRKILH